MINALAALLAFQLVGEAAAHLLHLPVPGPVLGMALLLVFLLFFEASAARLRPTAIEMLRHLSLLFVPAGVGILLHATRLAHEWLPILVALVGSTALAIVVTALVIEHSRRWLGLDRESGAQ
ncbi:MAG TPA: CidA/LrgA family protein [Burkholderiaceae bacterium]|jgi:holin-like protein|nr:CidA/LrgA family protein [Burkholderiaceae bacterium]HPE02429.1 CidA/LrgA family protein [Burkholderiaceae bacterium]